jgi:DNA-binding response OmpR family regulator
MDSAPSYRLLLVEDSEEQRVIIEHLLKKIESENYEIDTAGTYQEAVKLAEDNDYDAILIDYYLDAPHTALDVMDKLRLQSVPVLVITADSDRSVFLNCFQNGAKEFLNKPINAVEMQVRLRSVLHARNYERSLLEEIQERRRVEGQLRQQEKMNRILLDAVPYTIFRIDQHNHLADFKNDSEGLLSHLEGEIRGVHLRNLELSDNLTKQIVQLVQQVRESGADEEVSYSTRNSAFELIRYELLAYPADSRDVIIFLRSHSEQEEYSVLSAHNLSFNLSTKEVRRGTQTIYLNRKELRMLQYFMKNPNRILSKEMILNTVWGYDYEPEARVVDTLIARLRKKVDNDFEPKFIQTERGVGYSFKTSDWRKGRHTPEEPTV